MITELEPDILACKVKWALGSISRNKASGGDGIPAELFQNLKEDAVKADTSSTYPSRFTLHPSPLCALPIEADLTDHIKRVLRLWLSLANSKPRQEIRVGRKVGS